MNLSLILTNVKLLHKLLSEKEKQLLREKEKQRKSQQMLILLEIKTTIVKRN